MTMQNEQLFNELGVSPLLAIKMMESLDLSIEDIQNPFTFRRLQTVIDHLKGYSEDTQRFLIRKATLGKQDKLKCMDEYCDLLKEKKFNEDKKEQIKKEKSAIELSKDELKISEIKQKEQEINRRIAFISEEIDLYHK